MLIQGSYAPWISLSLLEFSRSCSRPLNLLEKWLNCPSSLKTPWNFILCEPTADSASRASDWQHAWNTGGRDLWACADYSLPCLCVHATVDFHFRIRATAWFVFANWTLKNAWWKLCVELIVVVETWVCWMTTWAERKQICMFLPCVQKSDRRESDGRVCHHKPRKRQET